MPSPDRQSAEYLCPGQTHPISRAVHLARLAAFDPACRECPHRNDTGQLPRDLLDRFVETQQRVSRPSWLSGEGVRAVYRNELDRPRAVEWAAALAARLWDRIPLHGSADLKSPEDADQPLRRLPGPSVVVGYDERPASPDLFAGILQGLKWMGCRVIDVGLATKPCWRFAVHHLDASAGIFVTGAGSDPAWTGFDLADRSGIPFRQSELAALELLAGQPAQRPTRQAGSVRSFPAVEPWRAGLKRHFHALRPLRVACGQLPGLSARWLAQLFDELPCQLRPLILPMRRRRLDDPEDVDIVRVGECVRQERLDLGLVIDEDGERCCVIDDTGRLLSQAQLIGLLCRRRLRDHPEGTVVLIPRLVEQVAEVIKGLHGQLVLSPEDPGDVADAVLARRAVLGADGQHRCWFDEDYPACDAVLTLAAVLQALSWSDAPLSEVAG